jgi:hypothetical protein
MIIDHRRGSPILRKGRRRDTILDFRWNIDDMGLFEYSVVCRGCLIGHISDDVSAISLFEKVIEHVNQNLILCLLGLRN